MENLQKLSEKFDLTPCQIEYAIILFQSQLQEILKGVESTAKVAKLIALAIDCTFETATKLMVGISNEFLNIANQL